MNSCACLSLSGNVTKRKIILSDRLLSLSMDWKFSRSIQSLKTGSSDDFSLFKWLRVVIFFTNKTSKLFQLCTSTATNTMHSQTSFTDRQTNLYCFNNDLNTDVNTCTSPTVEVDPLSSPIPTSSSVNLNSSFIEFVIANLSADEINRTGSATNERDELPSDLEMAIRRLTNEVYCLTEKLLFTINLIPFDYRNWRALFKINCKK